MKIFRSEYATISYNRPTSSLKTKKNPVPRRTQRPDQYVVLKTDQDSIMKMLSKTAAGSEGETYADIEGVTVDLKV